MKIFRGKVVSVKMAKTATVLVDTTSIHRLYKKRFTRSKKFQVHDVYESKVGDVVAFVPCKPISKLKRWRVVKLSGKTIPENKKTTKETQIKINKATKKKK